MRSILRRCLRDRDWVDRIPTFRLQAKARTAIAVPLNDTALSVLSQRLGQHADYVFTYRGKPIKQVSTPAWHRARARAGIADFHFGGRSPGHIREECAGRRTYPL